MIQVLEFTRGWLVKRFALALVIFANDSDELLAELRHAKQALIEWFERRGVKGRDVRFSVASSPELLDSYETILRRVCAEDIDLAPLLASRRVTIDFCDRRGKDVVRSVTLNA